MSENWRPAKRTHMVLKEAWAPLDQSAPALRTFFRIAELWGLSDKDQMDILDMGGVTFSRMKSSLALRLDKLARISHVLAIYKALQTLLPDAQAADGWVRRPNAVAPFGGRSALDLMVSGQFADLAAVREYLDGQVDS